MNWWEKYHFSNESEYEDWKAQAKKLIKDKYELSDEETDREFNIFDMFHGAPQSYLFTKEQKLF